MGVLGIILLVIFILDAILLIALVMMQDEQGEGLGGLFGGGSATTFGSRSGNVLTKFTSILGAIFLVCSFGLAWVNRTQEEGDVITAARRKQAEEGFSEAWWLPEDEQPVVEESGMDGGSDSDAVESSDGTDSGDE